MSTVPCCEGWQAWAASAGYALVFLALMVTFPRLVPVLPTVFALVALGALTTRWVGAEAVAASCAVAAVPLLGSGAAGLQPAGGEIGVTVGVVLLICGGILFWYSPTAQGT